MKQIIEIKRASAALIAVLIKVGILEVKEDGLHVVEKE